MGEGKFDQLFQKGADWLANKIAPGGFPTVPQGDKLFPDDTTTEKRESISIPPESKDTLFRNWEKYLLETGKIPKQDGHGVSIVHIESAQDLLGNQVGRGSSGRAFIDQKDHTFSKLWEQIPEEGWPSRNVHQRELYKRLAGQHPWFTFRREFPGGWSQEAIDNQGNLEDFLRNKGQLTQEQAKQAHQLLSQAHSLAKEAHGDLVKHPDYLNPAGQMRPRDLEQFKDFGYLNYKNILVALDGTLHIIDYAGNPDPFPLSGILDKDAKDPSSKVFKDTELARFKEGLDTIIEHQAKNPNYYVDLFLPMSVHPPISSEQ